MFIDQVHILVQAGSGGNGCASFQARTDRKSVPHGGDGGSGGSVIFRADPNAPGLQNCQYQQRLVAENGGHGGSGHKHGRNGKDFLILVPPGTRIMDRSRQLLIRHLEKAGDEVVVLRGGKGGQGNQGGRDATLGEKGQELEIDLSFFIPADVFFVGLPNSGKSTLMNRLTRAHLKAVDYPFATRNPEVGVWVISDYESLTFCELPSLYESSHEGRGVGADFLKHLEKAKFLLYVVDPVSQFAQSPAEGYAILRKELEIYSEDYLQIPHAVAVNKMDLPEAQAKVKEKKWKPKVPVFYISAATGEGMEKLTAHLQEQVLRHA